MISGFQKLACIFYIYSIGGWIMESIRGWIKTGKFVNRGFLIGPCLPVYGFGLVLLTLMLEDYTNDIFVLFTSSIFICGILEYFTSWAMEKIFKARWWDYHNRKFNINGRICLETLVPFGLAGTILLKYVNPFALNLISRIPSNILKLILIFLFLTIIIDAVISFFVIGNLRKTATEVEKEVVKDNTEEISNQVREITTQKIEEIAENTKNKLEELPDKI